MLRVLTQTFCVVGGLIEKNGKIALVQEKAVGQLDHGQWNHPAGWLDVGENPVVGTKREVEEETGFTFTPTAILGVYSLVKKYPDCDPANAVHRPIKIIFVGDIITDNQKQLADDVSTIQWFTPDEIYTMDSSTLRSADIKQMVKDYFDNKRYPLEIIHHFTQNKNSPK